jgi:hypothetical protein
MFLKIRNADEAKFPKLKLSFSITELYVHRGHLEAHTPAISNLELESEL